MKIQFLILLYLVCVNLLVSISMAISIPASEFVNPASGFEADDITETFNASEIAEDWESEPFEGLPVVGDIFSGFYFMFDNWEFLISGFSFMLRWVGDSYFSTTGGAEAFDNIANVLLAVYSVLMATFFIYLITGREI